MLSVAHRSSRGPACFSWGFDVAHRNSRGGCTRTHGLLASTHCGTSQFAGTCWLLVKTRCDTPELAGTRGDLWGLSRSHCCTSKVAGAHRGSWGLVGARCGTPQLAGTCISLAMGTRRGRDTCTPGPACYSRIARGACGLALAHRNSPACGCAAGLLKEQQLALTRALDVHLDLNSDHRPVEQLACHPFIVFEAERLNVQVAKTLQLVSQPQRRYRSTATTLHASILLACHPFSHSGCTLDQRRIHALRDAQSNTPTRYLVYGRGEATVYGITL